MSDVRMWYSILPALGEIGGADAGAALDAVINAPVKESGRRHLRARAAEVLMTVRGRDASHLGRLLTHGLPEVRRRSSRLSEEIGPTVSKAAGVGRAASGAALVGRAAWAGGPLNGSPRAVCQGTHRTSACRTDAGGDYSGYGPTKIFRVALCCR